jgi:hypothetical protein
LTWEREEYVMQTERENVSEPDTEEQESGGRHHAKDGAERHPLIDLDRDPTPGVADHARPDEDV